MDTRGIIRRTDSRGHEEDTKESSSGAVSTGKHDKRVCTCVWKDTRYGIGIWRWRREGGPRIERRMEGTYPCLLLSISRGATARMYVQVQMSRRMTSKRDWKLKSAD